MVNPGPSPLSGRVGHPGKPFYHPAGSNCPQPWLKFAENHGAIRAISADRLKVKGRGQGPGLGFSLGHPGGSVRGNRGAPIGEPPVLLACPFPALPTRLLRPRSALPCPDRQARPYRFSAPKPKPDDRIPSPPGQYDRCGNFFKNSFRVTSRPPPVMGPSPKNFKSKIRPIPIRR
jgi:hypothetical protein